jgi:hypothetical protein
MGVTTTADEKIMEARNGVDQAYRAILTVLDPDTWGHGDFNSEYIEKLHFIQLELLKIKKEL